MSVKCANAKDYKLTWSWKGLKWLKDVFNVTNAWIDVVKVVRKGKHYYLELVWNVKERWRTLKNKR